MKKLTLVLTLALFSTGLLAQQSRTEIASPASSNDSRPNSDSVPSGYALSAQFQRVVVLRFKYQTDLLIGLETMVKQEKIQNAVILAGIGSVRNYCYHAVSNRTFPTKSVFVTDSTAPADIAGMNGYIIDGRVHAHIMFADGKNAFGGHLEKGTNVFTFAIVTLGVLSNDVNLSRVDDTSYR